MKKVGLGMAWAKIQVPLKVQSVPRGSKLLAAPCESCSTNSKIARAIYLFLSNSKVEDF